VVRIRYAKEGPARYLSGLEIQSLWGRIIRRAGLPLSYSRGFNPAPKLSLSPALPVGAESDCEYLEGEFALPVPAAEVAAKLPAHLPPGIRLLEASGVPPGSPRLSDRDLACRYVLRPVPPAALPEALTPEVVSGKRTAFRAGDRHPVTVSRENQVSEVDLKPLVADFGVNPDGIFITILQGTGKGVRPLEAASALLGVPLPPDRFIARKVSAEFRDRRG
jgi:radical SAM-linked protein